MSIFTIFAILALGVAIAFIWQNWSAIKESLAPAEMIDTPIGEVELWKKGTKVKGVICKDSEGHFLCTKKHFNSPMPKFGQTKKEENNI